MHARITLFEIDTLRVNQDTLLEHFKENVMPELQRQPGYQGIYVMTTEEGRGMLMSLWTTEEEAMASIESGFYDEQVSKFVSFFRAPAGRDHYQVRYVDLRNQ